MTAVRYHRLAVTEMNDAACYYHLERPGLGRAFLAEVERSIEEITRHPVAGTIVRGEVRRRLLRRFPYAVLYRVKPEEIRVLAIANLRRRPSYWMGRS